MKINPKLIKRFGNRHDKTNAYAKYYPFEIGKNDDLSVGQLVRIKSEPDGDEPKKGGTDMRTVEVVDTTLRYSSSDDSEDRITVFLKDLTPVRIGQSRSG